MIPSYPALVLLSFLFLFLFLYRHCAACLPACRLPDCHLLIVQLLEQSNHIQSVSDVDRRAARLYWDVASLVETNVRFRQKQKQQRGIREKTSDSSRSVLFIPIHLSLFPDAQHTSCCSSSSSSSCSELGVRVGVLELRPWWCTVEYRSMHMQYLFRHRRRPFSMIRFLRLFVAEDYGMSPSVSS